MSVIKAGTTLTTAYIVDADTTGALEFKTGPSATLAMSISASGVVTFPATTGFDIASANITNLTSTTLTVSKIGIFPAGSATVAAITTVGDTNNGIFFPAADVTAITTAGTERLRVDASGNLGLGVTPSAWSSGARALQVGNQLSLWEFSGGLYLTNNRYFDTGATNKYIANGAASSYEQNNGAHIWLTSASGTAGGTLTSTTLMTLTASGNLGVGTTTINYRVVADCAGAGSNDNGIAVRNDNNSAYGGSYNFEHKVTSGGSVVRASYISSEGGSGTSFLRFATTNASTLAERARITGGGDLYLGKSASSASTVGFEWTASGRATHVFTESSTNECYTYNNTSTSGTAVIDFRTNNVTKGRITWDNTNTTYATTSDRRLKDNITPAADAGAVIDAIEVVKHDWKVGGHTRYGVIAQDLYEVAPEAVAIGDDGEEVGRAWAVDYSKLVPMLVKEIQSLRGRSSALEAKVAALETK